MREITIRLHEQEYEALEALADRQGINPHYAATRAVLRATTPPDTTLPTPPQNTALPLDLRAPAKPRPEKRVHWSSGPAYPHCAAMQDGDWTVTPDYTGALLDLPHCPTCWPQDEHEDCDRKPTQPEPHVEIGGHRMPESHWNAARFPLLTGNPGPAGTFGAKAGDWWYWEGIHLGGDLPPRTCDQPAPEGDRLMFTNVRGGLPNQTDPREWTLPTISVDYGTTIHLNVTAPVVVQPKED